jgi:ABC-2 type transport system permease protein
VKQAVLIVAWWEFTRYFKIKDQLYGVLAMLIASGLAAGAIQFAQSSSQIELAVIGAAESLDVPDDSNFALVDSNAGEIELRGQVDRKEIDGLLILRPSDNELSGFTVELIVRSQPTWLMQLQPVVDSLKSRLSVEHAGISPETLAQVFSPAEIKVTSLTDHSVAWGDRIAAFMMILAMLMTSWLGLAFFLTGITGEKQLRVTEQIVSAISPQTWVDGKLVGLTAAGFGSLFSFVITGIGSYFIARWIGYEIPLPDAIHRWDLFPWLILLLAGGAVLWNCFYAAVSAIIDDPNTSSKGSLLFAPVLPMIAALFAIPQPDGMAMRVLSLIPGTSSTAMPIRMILGEVSRWEILASILFLLMAIYLLRLFAGRIFAAGIMLHGKEPSWFDVMRWAISGTATRD